MSKNLTVVIKASKLCNLRCTYCYEFDDLHNSAKIEKENLLIIFKKLKEIANYIDAELKICWHGGEPLLFPAGYFEYGIKLQEDVFGARVPHFVQTNLFHLNANNVQKLRLFDHVSISIDINGAQRLDIKGKDSRDRVLVNMDRLRQVGISFGAITVLTRNNFETLESTFEFFNRAAVSFRILPFYREASPSQTLSHGLTAAEVRTAMLSMLDLWMKNGKGLSIYPLEDSIRIAARYHAGNTRNYRYDKSVREHVLVIDTNGDVYSSGTAYNQGFKYGNILTDSADELLGSPGRSAAIDRANKLMKAVCTDCEFFGSCSGYYTAEQTDVELAADVEKRSCPIMYDTIVRSLEWIRTLPTDYVGAQTQAGRESWNETEYV